jgi:hypothetical protein
VFRNSTPAGKNPLELAMKKPLKLGSQQAAAMAFKSF